MDPRFLPYLAQQTAETQAPTTPAGSPQGPGGLLTSQMYPILMIVGVFAVMYFFSIRPARKEEKRKKEMLSALKKGDTIITSSGIIGSVHAVKEDTVILRVGDNTRIEMLRSAVQEVRGRSTAEKGDKEDGN